MRQFAWDIKALGDGFHEQSKPVFWKKYESIINLSSADLALAQRVVKVNL